MTVSLLLAAACLFVLLARARRADRRLAGQPRLPMQWGLSGQVTWTAPRRVALATVPVLAAVVIALALANPDRGLASPLPVLVLSLGFLFLQTVHLNKLGEAAERTLQALPHA